MQKALGLIETIGLVTAIEAADAAVKAANVVLLGYENTKGGGKITIKLVGDVGAVQAGVAAGVAAALRIGKVYGQRVIPRPHEEIDALIRQVDRGRVKETPAPAAPAAAPQAPVAAAAVEPAAAVPAEAVPDGAPAPAEEKRCIAITKAGARCTLPARPGSQYCTFHRKLDQAAG
ncbi:MAG: BMC domain-containing protein [Chloroflexota bacterium]